MNVTGDKVAAARGGGYEIWRGVMLLFILVAKFDKLTLFRVRSKI
jgi:hypothetical protein